MRLRPSHQGLHPFSVEEEEEDNDGEEDPFADVNELEAFSKPEEDELHITRNSICDVIACFLFCFCRTCLLTKLKFE